MPGSERQETNVREKWENRKTDKKNSPVHHQFSELCDWIEKIVKRTITISFNDDDDEYYVPGTKQIWRESPLANCFICLFWIRILFSSFGLSIFGTYAEPSQSICPIRIRLQTQRRWDKRSFTYAWPWCTSNVHLEHNPTSISSHSNTEPAKGTVCAKCERWRRVSQSHLWPFEPSDQLRQLKRIKIWEYASPVSSELVNGGKSTTSAHLSAVRVKCCVLESVFRSCRNAIMHWTRSKPCAVVALCARKLCFVDSRFTLLQPKR